MLAVSDGKCYASILDAIRPPDLMIYLRCSMRTLRRRIRLRGRAMERDVPLSYLKRLERLYEAWIDDYSMSGFWCWRPTIWITSTTWCTGWASCIVSRPCYPAKFAEIRLTVGPETRPA